jgi:KaiC/GvpD/RAD55 family RecA-like ATPase
MNVSIYNNAYDTDSSVSSADLVVRDILVGKWSSKIYALRGMDKKQYDEEKKKLPGVTFSGTFKKGTRLKTSIESYTGLIVIDIDKIDDAQITMLKQQFSADPHVKYIFVSPSGKGLKVIFLTNLTSSEHHLSGFLHLQKYVQDNYFVKVDPSGKDECRLCFVSSDEYAVIKDASPFEVDLKYGEIVPRHTVDAGTYTQDAMTSHVFDICTKWVEKTKTYVEGQRNVYIHALACALNRCGVPLENTMSTCISKFTDLDQKEVATCVRSAYFHNQAEHGTVKIKDAETINFVAPPYIANYTDDVAANDLMRITATLYHNKIQINDIIDIVGKVGRYYDSQGYIDLRRNSLPDLMNKAVMVLNQNIASASAANSLKYVDAASLGSEIVKMKLTEGFVKMYLPFIDMEMFGGMMPGSFYELIGLGGTYKSILAQYAALRNAMADNVVLYLNGEMSSFQFYGRLATMTMGINLRQELAEGRINDSNIDDFMKNLSLYTKNNLFVVNGNGFNQKNVYATIQNIKATTGKDVKFIVIDGITQMDSSGKEEIQATIHNSGVCKEIAKETNCVVLGLLHMSGDAGHKTLRDTGKRVRGGIKTTANADGYFSTSLLIDPNSKTLDNPDEIDYIPNKLYLRLTDKRTETGVVSCILNLDKNLHLSVEQCDPSSYEFNPNKK